MSGRLVKDFRASLGTPRVLVPALIFIALVFVLVWISVRG